jgi:hypothetical protein
VTAEPPFNLNGYRDMVQEGTFPNETIHQGGVDVDRVPTGTDGVAFVGYRGENGEVIKLNVTDVLVLGGFAQDKAPVLIVEMTADWLWASFVHRALARITSAAYSGEPDKVLDEIAQTCGAIGQDRDTLWQRYYQQMFPATGTGENDATQIMQMVSDSTDAGNTYLSTASYDQVAVPVERPEEQHLHRASCDDSNGNLVCGFPPGVSSFAEYVTTD